MSAAAKQSQMPLHFVPDQAAVGHEALSSFHPVVQAWFHQTLGDPTEPQIQGWPVIRSGRDVLIAAPTGSGKTLTAFLACLDELFRLALRHEAELTAIPRLTDDSWLGVIVLVAAESQGE